jgi:hypothetical protein
MKFLGADQDAVGWQNQGQEISELGETIPGVG